MNDFHVTILELSKGIILTGREFKDRYGNIFYKFLNRRLKHYNYEYKLGLNRDHIVFNPNTIYGLHFANIQNIFNYYSLGPYIATVRIPDDALVCINKSCYKANKIIIETISYAETRFIELMSLAYQLGYQWDANVTKAAVKNGHLHVLKYLYYNGCPINKWAYKFAKLKNYQEIQDFLRDISNIN